MSWSPTETERFADAHHGCVHTGSVARTEGAGRLEANSEVGVLGEWGGGGAARLDAELDEPAQCLPAGPRVGVAERALEEGAQRGAIGVDHRVDRGAAYRATRVAEQTAPG